LEAAQVSGVMPHPGVGSDTRTSVYRLFGADGALLYVGMGRNPMNRWSQHAVNHPWWMDVATFETAWYATREEASAEEKRAIRDEDPRHNIHGRPGWGQYVYGKYMEALELNASKRRVSNE
jgi:hypothetical protein